MNTQSLDLQLEMLLDRSRVDFYPPFDVQGPADLSAPSRRGRRTTLWAMIWIVMGFGILTAVLLVLATNGDRTPPEIWSHGAFALIAAEVLIVIGAVLRITSSVNESKELIRSFLRSQSVRRSAPVRTTTGPLLSSQLGEHQQIPKESSVRKPLKGQIGDRDFILHTDGSVELETLLGPRRFASLQAAKEFVGGEVLWETDGSASRPLLAA